MASMNALVKELVLLGGWLAFAAFGYYAVSRLGDFLEQCQAEGEAAYDLPEEQGDLNIAAASPWAMQAGSQVLKAMQREHPHPFGHAKPICSLEQPGPAACDSGIRGEALRTGRIAVCYNIWAGRGEGPWLPRNNWKSKARNKES